MQTSTSDQQTNAIDGIAVAIQTLNEAYTANPGALSRQIIGWWRSE
jgi:hypothetical protein